MAFSILISTQNIVCVIDDCRIVTRLFGSGIVDFIV